MNSILKVLVVEDEDVLRKGIIVTTQWEKLHLRVIGESDNGSDGEVMVRKLNPDIVIADIAMPGKDGLQMIKDLSSMKNTPEFIIISGHPEFSYAQKAVEYGVKGYILKPVNPEELYSVLARTVESIEQKKNEQSIEKKLETLEGRMQKVPILTDPLPSDYRETYVQDAVSILEKHYSEHLKASDIAQYLGISERGLIEHFKTYLGYTFLEYLTTYRMNKASFLLKEKTLTVYQVAEKVGYKDYRYFCKIFKTHFAMTPLEYKKGGMST